MAGKYFLAIFFDFGEVDDAVHERLCQPLQKVIDKRFRDFVRVHFGRTRSKAGVPATPMVTANGGSGGYWRRSAPTIDGVRKRGQPCINAFT
jgi:hypothetical protein